MNAQKKLAITLIALLLFTPLFFANSAAAAFTLSVTNLTDGSTYIGSTRIVDFSVNYDLFWWSGGVIDCYVDRQLVAETELTSGRGEITLTGLSQGPHELSVTGKTINGYFGDMPFDLTPVKINFYVNLGIGPTLALFGLEEFYAPEVTFNLTSSLPLSTVYYWLDDATSSAVLPFSALTTSQNIYQYSVSLSNLTEGFHLLNITASESMFGNLGFTEKAFTINNPLSPQPTEQITPQPKTPTSLTLVMFVLIVIVAIVLVSFIIFFKKRIHKTQR